MGDFILHAFVLMLVVIEPFACRPLFTALVAMEARRDRLQDIVLPLSLSQVE